jgi:SAM-dependent methyltransferase
MGLDINEHATRFARDRGLSVKIGALDAAVPAGQPSSDEGPPVDAVAIWNCFEQLADPRAVAREARRRLTPGGIFAVRVPNGATYAKLARVRQGLSGRMARGFLAQNNLLGFPYRHGFTTGSLSLLLERTGFEVVRVYGDSLVPIADKWTRAWAALEERLVKDLTHVVAVSSPRANELAPWLEVYARAV